MAVIERRRVDPSALVYLEKIPLGTPYVRVVERVRQIAQHREVDRDKRKVVVDATGVGMPKVWKCWAGQIWDASRKR